MDYVKMYDYPKPVLFIYKMKHMSEIHYFLVFIDQQLKSCLFHVSHHSHHIPWVPRIHLCDMTKLLICPTELHRVKIDKKRLIGLS